MTYGQERRSQAFRWQIAAPDVRAQHIDAKWRNPSCCVEDPGLAQVGLDPGTSLNLTGEDPQERVSEFGHGDETTGRPRKRQDAHPTAKRHQPRLASRVGQEHNVPVRRGPPARHLQPARSYQRPGIRHHSGSITGASVF